MKDDKGVYYHPDPSDSKTRVYVREECSAIEFRMWRLDHPEIWERHGWLTLGVLEAAASMYKESGTGADPLILYDSNVARALLKDEERKNADKAT